MPIRPASASASASLFARYEPLSGVPDELSDVNGAMRPAWAGLIDHLSSLGPADIAHDFARGEQHLADAGVFFRRYGDTTLSGRDWPFSPIPVILPEAEWRDIKAGLVQRADLLEHVVADLYGENRLVSEGLLPAALVAQNPEWLRPMVGVTPRSGRFLHFIAFEIGRGPDGRWWVLSDLTDAPSGAGFALENRVATTRVFPDLYRKTPVHRLAGFFRAYRDALEHLRGSEGGSAGILTPGPLTDTYYEQAYIARYLGLPLLEGGDLTVEDGRLWVRTVKGLAPVDVLWRRMDGIWADPLELREDSQLGTPGLMSAIRQGQVTMANALGVGVLETQALMAFLPRIARAVTGAPLAIPNVATWWCGQSSELDHVRANAARMMIGPAMSTRMPYETAATHAIGGQMRGHGDQSLDDWLMRNAGGLMAKELVTLSTTPVFQEDRLVPRPMTIRVFLARGRDGWEVMPGGFARVGSTTDTTAISMREGGAVADVWVVADSAVEPVSMLAPPSAPFVRTAAGPLPSRAADNLFWLGRYVERTEGLLRLVRAYHSRLDEVAPEPLLALIRDSLASYGVTADEALPKGLRDTLASAVNSASQIRDRFSVDGWAALKDMEKSMTRIARTADPGNDAALVMSVMLRKIAGFSGLVHENMHRSASWQFLTIGRSLERAAMMTDLLAAVTGPEAPEGGLDLAIEIGDSIMTHRQRYAVITTRDTVLDLLVLDESNPRSVRFHLDVICKRLADLTEAGGTGQLSVIDRQALAVQSSVAIQSVALLDAKALRKAKADILALSPALGAAFLQ
ncbi:MAG: circularly permuted type 2 ATP-grasp protein [Flavimaricola sp.]|nr:circularly permuted type 2 ATP-grasp protein [Flavimaricola sp.]